LQGLCEEYGEEDVIAAFEMHTQSGGEARPAHSTTPGRTKPGLSLQEGGIYWF